MTHEEQAHHERFLSVKRFWNLNDYQIPERSWKSHRRTQWKPRVGSVKSDPSRYAAHMQRRGLNERDAWLMFAAWLRRNATRR